jgi:hypothetical protein
MFLDKLRIQLALRGEQEPSRLGAKAQNATFKPRHDFHGGVYLAETGRLIVVHDSGSAEECRVYGKSRRTDLGVKIELNILNLSGRVGENGGTRW